jgi:hypothetical protein
VLHRNITPQSDTINSLLSVIPKTMELQQAFKTVPQPASAQLHAMLCSCSTGFHSFVRDTVAGNWVHYGDGASAVGSEWEDVVSTCAFHRYKPDLVIYQVHQGAW